MICDNFTQLKLPKGDTNAFYATPVEHLQNARIYICDLLGNPLSSLNLLKIYNYDEYLAKKKKAEVIKKDIDSLLNY